MIKSILELEILLWYMCRSQDFPDLDARAVKDAIERFVELELLIEDNGGRMKYLPNRIALDVWLNEIKKIPLPEKGWIINSPENK